MLLPSSPDPDATTSLAADALAVAHVAHAIRFARRHCRLRDAEWFADEAESAAMVALVEAARAFVDRGTAKFTTYLYARVGGAVGDLLRGGWKRSDQEAGETIGPVLDTHPTWVADPRPDADPAVAAIRAEDTRRLAGGLGRIKGEPRRVIMARYFLCGRDAVEANRAFARVHGRASRRIGDTIERQTLARLREMLGLDRDEPLAARSLASMTRHALMRVAHRNVPPEAIEAVRRYGARKPSSKGDGSVIRQLDPTLARRFPELAPWVDLRVVEAGNGRVKTVLWAEPPGKGNGREAG